MLDPTTNIHYSLPQLADSL